MILDPVLEQLQACEGLVLCWLRMFFDLYKFFDKSKTVKEFFPVFS